MQHINILKVIVKDEINTIFRGKIAEKLLALQHVLDQNIILHTHDQIVKRTYLNNLIAVHNSVTTESVEAHINTVVFDGLENRRKICYKTHVLFLEIDMDPSNASDICTFNECMLNLCCNISFDGRKRIVVLSRVDRMQLNMFPSLSRAMAMYHNTCTFVLTCDSVARCPPSVRNMCLAINLSLDLTHVLHVAQLLVKQVRPDVTGDLDILLKRCDFDLTNIALTLALASPLSYTGHMYAVITAGITDLVRLVDIDNLLYSNALRDLIIKLGASCTDPARIGKIVIEFSEEQHKDTYKIVEASSEMQNNIVKVGKTIFSLERYIHRVVEIFRVT